MTSFFCVRDQNQTINFQPQVICTVKLAKLNQSGFNYIERRTVATLASVYGLRMFGLFLILPVLSIYAEQLDGATPMLMGVALGIYGISQAMFQIPFGALSDRFGRKPLIIFGLTLFVIGSLVAAFADTIVGVIIGRALQGSGAIAAVVMALTSDLTREDQRTKAMAFIGMSIGLAFMLALVAAPVLASIIGVRGLFVMTALLAIMSMIVIIKVVPSPARVRNLEVNAVPVTMLAVLKNRTLLRLDCGIFILHFVLTAMFVAIPIALLEQLQLDTQSHWRVYLPSLGASVVLMVPLIILSSRRNWTQRVFMMAVCIVLFAQALLLRGADNLNIMILCLTIFFLGFNLLEAMLPSLVSRLAPAATKGSAMGVYNTFQFLGVFFGGLIGGTLYGRFGVSAVYLSCAIALLIWIVIIYRTEPFKLLDSLVITVNNEVAGSDLCKVGGVEEAVVVHDDNVAYLKIDSQRLDRETLQKLIM